MIKNILIASATRPIDGKKPVDIYEQVRTAALSMSCAIIGGIYTRGPGCINFGFKVFAPNQKTLDNFGTALCMAFMPAKWCETKDKIKDGFIDEVT